MTTSAPTIVHTGKNLGKSNATNVLTQAYSECTSKYTKKIKSGYTEEISHQNKERSNADVPIPMNLKQWNDFKEKLTKAVNLDVLKKQREQVQQYVTQLEKQLPSKAEMDALLSDINQAGLGRSLTFDLFRPGTVSVKEYYAELPIEVRVAGRYHDIGSFASDIAHLSRIVTLNNLTITPVAGGNLSLGATAKTFRYLDSEEVNAQRKAVKPGAKK